MDTENQANALEQWVRGNFNDYEAQIVHHVGLTKELAEGKKLDVGNFCKMYFTSAVEIINDVSSGHVSPLEYVRDNGAIESDRGFEFIVVSAAICAIVAKIYFEGEKS